MQALNGQRGIATVVVAVSLVALMGAAVLSIDSGSLWATRRAIITGTDAAVLDAAQLFNSGAADACVSSDRDVAEDHATSVLLQNSANAIHNDIETPNGFEVTTAIPCGTASYIPGKVRYDGRLASQISFAGMFGFDPTKVISSSTAAWGYITAIGEGLRPFAVCDQLSHPFPDPLPPAPAAPHYPQYHLWNELWHDRIDQATYDSYFGTDPVHYPSSSSGWDDGYNNKNPNEGLSYVAPTGSNGHSTIMRITMPDPDCGTSPGNRIWVNFDGPEGGTVGAFLLRDWILKGYPRGVSLDPHDCNMGDGISPQDCGGKPGNTGGVVSALATITCPVATVADDCDYVFPLLVTTDIWEDGGANIHYPQVAFLTVVLRGFAQLTDTKLQFDFEFVDQQISGAVGATPPSPDHPYQTGVQLCGVDHDTADDRCPF